MTTLLVILDFLQHWLWHRPVCCCMGVKSRSSKWPAARRAWLKEHPACEGTGATDGLIEVHHKKPFSDSPELELDPANFVTARRDVHFLICHSDNWRSYNPHVVEDLAALRERIRTRP